MKKLLLILLLVPTLFCKAQPTIRIVCHGNSLTKGTGLNQPYPVQLHNLLGNNYFVYNGGIDGYTTTDMISGAPGQIDQAIINFPFNKNVLIGWEISNDLAIYGVSAQVAFNHIKQYCLNRKAAGWKVVVATMLPRTALLNFYTPAQIETIRQTVNTQIRNEWPTFADAIADVGDLALPRWDGVHLNEPEYAVIASVMKNAVLSILEPITVPDQSTAVTTIAPTGPLGAGNVTYKVQGGEDAAKFVIDSVSGLLSFIAPPNYSTPADLDGDNVYEVIVRSSNGSAINDQPVNAKIISGTILPIKFTSFKAIKQNNAVQLNWQIATPINNTRYEVERSADGSSFSTVGTINASGNEVSFSWTDAAPLKGTNLYRIKSIEPTGAIVYSAVVKISTEKNTSGISIFPNPVTGRSFNVQMDNEQKGELNLVLTNITGQVVFSQTINNPGGNASSRIQLGDNIAPGIYNVQIINSKSRQSEKLMIR